MLSIKIILVVFSYGVNMYIVPYSTVLTRAMCSECNEAYFCIKNKTIKNCIIQNFFVPLQAINIKYYECIYYSIENITISTADFAT